MSHIKTAFTHGAPWLLAGLLLYAVVLRQAVQAHWLVRFFMLTVLLVLPWAGINALAIVFGASVHPSWMLAPLLLTVIAPTVEP